MVNLVDRLTVRVIFVATAILWLAVGVGSKRLGVLPLHAWIVLSSVPAGAAAAVAHHVTRSSLRWYVIAVCGVATVRSFVYIIDDRGTVGPAVWSLIVVQSVLMYELLAGNETR